MNVLKTGSNQKQNNIPKCPYCGVEFVPNKLLPANVSKDFKDVLGMIPNCECQEKRHREQMLQTIIDYGKKDAIKRCNKFKSLSLIDDKFRSAHFETADMKSEAMQLAKGFADKLKIKKGVTGIWFYGNVGTGKTFAATCIANSLMEEGFGVLSLNLGIYLSEMKAVASGWEEKEVTTLKYVEKADLLILDDFGTERYGEINAFEQAKIFNLIDRRYRSKKPLVVTSNLSLKEMMQIYGTRIADRLREMCMFFEVTGQTRRESGDESLMRWLV